LQRLTLLSFETKIAKVIHVSQNSKANEKTYFKALELRNVHLVLAIDGFNPSQTMHNSYNMANDINSIQLTNAGSNHLLLFQKKNVRK